jgi:uncharacterized protein YycO
MTISKTKKVFLFSTLTVLVIFSLLLLSFSLEKKECENYLGSLNASELSNVSSSKSVITDINLKEGDIIFHSSQSKQCSAIQLATKSIYSHCGILFNYSGKLQVLEAVQPVKITPIEEFIKRGKDEHFVVKRLIDSPKKITDQNIIAMKKIGDSYKGKNYDIYFNWNDDELYCSELVWKIYEQGAGIKIGELKPLSSFDLSHPEVKSIMKERYGAKIPLSEMMISPVSIFESPLIYTVIEK